MAGARKASMQMTQSQWQDWAVKRHKQADEVHKLFRKQSREVQAVINEKGCSCDPMIVMRQGEHGGPQTKEVVLTHAMDCPHG